VRDEDQLARHGVPVDAVTLLHAGHQTLHHAFDVIHIQTRPMEGAVGERAAQHFAKSTHAAFAQRILRLHHQAARPHTQEHAIAPTIEGRAAFSSTSSVVAAPEAKKPAPIHSSRLSEVTSSAPMTSTRRQRPARIQSSAMPTAMVVEAQAALTWVLGPRMPSSSANCA